MNFIEISDNAIKVLLSIGLWEIGKFIYKKFSKKDLISEVFK